MAVSATIRKQLGEVADMSGMTVEDYAQYLGTSMPRASAQDKVKIAAQIYRTGACPLQGHAVVMVHAGSHNLALTYDGWVAAGQRHGITSTVCDIEDKAGEPWAVRATVTKSDGQPYSRTEVIEENRAMGAKNSKAWKNMPLRMTQHRAIISAIRCACSINSMASVEELQDAGFQRADSMNVPEVVATGEEVFKTTAKVKPMFKGTGSISVKSEQGKAASSKKKGKKVDKSKS